jgi:hypothetical protein
MFTIYFLVQKTLQTGYLSLETESQIQALFHHRCNTDDIEALICLQQAVALGCVKRQALEIQECVALRTPQLQLA